jgi:cardiolipin synthase A/B
VAGARLGCATSCDHGPTETPQTWFSEPGDLPKRGATSPEVLRDLDRLTGASPTTANSVRILSDGADSFGAMLEIVRAAVSQIRFENFIFRFDTVGHAFAQELRLRAREGVSVRVLHDPAGALMTGGRSAGLLFRGSRAEVGLFNVGLPTRRRRSLGRDHRKMVVSDSGQLVAGGICLADAWAGNCVRHCTWRDSAVHVKGPAARVAAAAFDETWKYALIHRSGRGAAEAVRPSEGHQGDVPVRILSNLGARRPTLAVLERVIAAASDSVLITNPYVVPPPALVDGLTRAARRGVEVTLLVPGSNNHRLVGLSLEHGLGALLDAGCRVFRWRGAMLHAKSVVVDASWTLIGSTNLDHLSLHKNAELDVEVHGTAVGHEMTRIFRADCEGSEALTLEGWMGRSFGRRAIARLATGLRRWQ